MHCPFYYRFLYQWRMYNEYDKIFGNDFDRKMMGKALARARAASKAGEVPIGALVVNAHGLIIGSGYNQVEKYQSQAKHAEMIALTKCGAHAGRLAP